MSLSAGASSQRSTEFTGTNRLLITPTPPSPMFSVIPSNEIRDDSVTCRREREVPRIFIVQGKRGQCLFSSIVYLDPAALRRIQPIIIRVSCLVNCANGLARSLT